MVKECVKNKITKVDILCFEHEQGLFPNIINDVAKAYNEAYVLIEVNDIGGQVADIMQFDLEYENILMCAMRGRAGQIVGQGFSHKSQLGIKMTSTVKKTGCSNLKALIEDDKLLIQDYDIIAELTTFIQRKQSFEALEGCNDDLAMWLVIYAWLVVQPYFKELTSDDIRKRLFEDQREAIENPKEPKPVTEHKKKQAKVHYEKVMDTGLMKLISGY